MPFLFLWLAIGVLVLVVFGIDDVVAYIALDLADTSEERFNSPLYFALCLTLIVIAWPVVLIEYIHKKQ